MNTHPLDFELAITDLENKVAELSAKRPSEDPLLTAARQDLEKERKALYSNLTPWQRVQIARHPTRPYFLDYIEACVTDFVELHGDRLFGDDKAMPAGIGRIGGHRCIIIGQQKGRDVKENVLRNFGSPHPEGYRKALVKMRLAQRFKLPVICFIDTPGAYPGIAAEERGQAAIIAENLMYMSQIDTPIVCVVIGEGGSGGALGIGIGDKVAMLEHAYYSVISPEGCATILWKSNEHWPKAAAALKLTSRDLIKFGVIDEVIPEPLGAAHRDHREAASNLKSFLARALREIGEIPRDQLLQKRYEKFRKIGVFVEGEPA